MPILCITDLRLNSKSVSVELDSELEYLSLIEESGSYHESRAVFSGLGTGVEVKEYSNFELYDWRSPVEFSEILDVVEPLYPFVEDPALEMIKEEGRVRNADRDHVTMSNEYVYDPVKEWRAEEDESRWNEYSLIQLNLNGAKVVWDQKQPEKDSRIRIYSLDGGSEFFADIYPRVVDENVNEEDVTGIVDDVTQVF